MGISVGCGRLSRKPLVFYPCDRFSSYQKYLRDYGHGLTQFCWAHLKRDLLGAREVARSPGGKRFCGCARRLWLWSRSCFVCGTASAVG